VLGTCDSAVAAFAESMAQLGAAVAAGAAQQQQQQQQQGDGG
jgi:hypothetical protein